MKSHLINLWRVEEWKIHLLDGNFYISEIASNWHLDLDDAVTITDVMFIAEVQESFISVTQLESKGAEISIKGELDSIHNCTPDPSGIRNKILGQSNTMCSGNMECNVWEWKIAIRSIYWTGGGFGNAQTIWMQSLHLN
jgi:hypothetical protein